MKKITLVGARDADASNKLSKVQINKITETEKGLLLSTFGLIWLHTSSSHVVFPSALENFPSKSWEVIGQF